MKRNRCGEAYCPFCPFQFNDEPVNTNMEEPAFRSLKDFRLNLIIGSKVSNSYTFFESIYLQWILLREKNRIDDRKSFECQLDSSNKRYTLREEYRFSLAFLTHSNVDQYTSPGLALCAIRNFPVKFSVLNCSDRARYEMHSHWLYISYLAGTNIHLCILVDWHSTLIQCWISDFSLASGGSKQDTALWEWIHLSDLK